jgi:hypothetical protein
MFSSQTLGTSQITRTYMKEIFFFTAMAIRCNLSHELSLVHCYLTQPQFLAVITPRIEGFKPEQKRNVILANLTRLLSTSFSEREIIP